MRLSIFIFSICFNFSLNLQGQTINKSDSIIQSIINNPQTKLERDMKSDGSIKEFYELKNQRNKWTVYKEYYTDESLKELGVFLNGYQYGYWSSFDSNGKISSQIDYNSPKQIVGKPQMFVNTFSEAMSIGDSILRAHFNPNVISNIRFNASRSYWYTDLNSGTWYENSENEPKSYLLRYSIVIHDTLIFTPLEVNLKKQQKLEIVSIEGFPSSSSFGFKIDYNRALEIAKAEGYGEIHNTAFHESEYLNLIVRDDEYYWVISKISDDLFRRVDKSNGGIISAIGKTLYINCLTGETTERDSEDVIIVD